MFVKHCRVEVYFIEFELAHNDDLTKIEKRKFSKADTIGEREKNKHPTPNWPLNTMLKSLGTIAKTLRSLFNVPEESEIRLWNKYTADTYEQLTNMENTVQDQGLYGGQLILIETKNANGEWPRVAKR